MAVEIFFCYAHRDEDLLNKLKTHLIPLCREGLIDLLWHDRNISAGTEWEREIDTYLNKAQIILLLVSPDFIASEYCYSIEMKRAIERHEQNEARVIPIILRHVYWQVEPLSRLQALPKDAKPVNSWQDEDEAFFNVVQGIRNTIEELNVQTQAPIPLPDTLEAAPSTSVPSNPPDQYVTSLDATPNQSSQTTAATISQQTSSTAPIEATVPDQPPQQKVDLRETLTRYRNRLAEMEAKLDLGTTSQITEEFAGQLHTLLREVISTIRTMPQEASDPHSGKYFTSKDDVLENLRQARIQVMMAINSIPTFLMRPLFDRSKPETFYQCLLSCREYLERALNHW